MSTPLRKKRANSVIWALMALMMLGLGGYGITNFSSGVSEIGHVGDRKITVNDYARTLRRELQTLSQQAGKQVSFAEAQQSGVDQAVQAQLVSAATLEDEASKLGISVGDAAVRERIMTAKALQGADGKFDRDAYSMFLKDQNLTEAEFERTLRDEAARNILQNAVLSGLAVPAGVADRLTAWAGETRSLTFAQLVQSDLPEAVAAPGDEQLKTWYDSHNDLYMKPETRKITYVWLAPEDLIDQVQVDDAELQKAYDQRKSEFVVPEKRMVERLVYPTAAEATEAKARLDAGKASFADLAKERGLSLGDTDLGEVSKDDLGKAGEAVFALKDNGVIGPVDSDLGPALFAVNGIIAAQTTTFDQAKAGLKTEVAMDQARRLVSKKSETIQDLLAGGATLSDVAKEAGMKLDHVDYNSESDGGMTGYEAFRKAAEAATPQSFPELVPLDDGGVFALQLDSIEPAALRLLSEVHDKVAADWTADETHKRLVSLASEQIAALDNGATLQGLGLVTTHLDDFARGGFIADAPAEIAKQIFDMPAGSHRVIDTENKVFLVSLESVTPADLQSEDVKARHDQLQAGLTQSLSRDVFAMYARAVQANVGITLNTQTIAAVNAQMQ